jgi:hypothetical protein
LVLAMIWLFEIKKRLRFGLTEKYD